MPTFIITPEPLPGPTYRVEQVPTLIHPHPAAIGDIDDRALWRYLDLPKYLSFLSSGAIYFTRADQFTQMDPMERSWGRVDLEGETAEANAQARRSLYNSMGKYFVSCWHLSEYESAAMWDIYGKVGAGVALKTSLRKFLAICSTQDPMNADLWRIVPLEVQYLNYQKEGIGMENALHLLRSKRKSYEHEREIRMALIQPAAAGIDEVVGVQMPINIGEVIDAIYINPRAPSWVYESIVDVSGHYGVQPSKVRQSALDEQPLI
ncbi:MAG TPA: DUF2971 domain-containing protein [Candidatus Baltobacteraceae bacterium]|nr:DUF2971 domain-containing protein [Candidatus Baltobacteraceae bacterium]